MRANIILLSYSNKKELSVLGCVCVRVCVWINNNTLESADCADCSDPPLS